MLINNLKGGLGNQMFQYATGLFLAHKNWPANISEKYSLDIYGLKKTFKETERDFRLDFFNITALPTKPKAVRKIKYPLGLISKFQRLIDKKVFRHFYLDYHPEFLEKVDKKLIKGDDFYLDGFFQSEKNFARIRPEILKEFSLQEEFKSPELKLLEQQIKSQNSVSIHIRRGDYVADQKTNQYHGTCSLDYYQKAMKLIKEKLDVSDLTFYVFTDDPEWVNKNLNADFINISEGNKFEEYEELYLMSRCGHNIIANSSFSWWGAWLNQNPDKIVIAPEKWTKKKPNPHPNIIPKSWIKI